jgi:hypothetical protein
MSTPSQIPGLRRLHVVVEGGDLDGAFVGPRTWPSLGADVTICSGPEPGHDSCPLVADGHCPAGRPDVVVHTMGGDWSGAVSAAWRELGVQVVDAGDVAWPTQVGLGVGAIFQRF